MAASDGFVELLHEQLSPLGHIVIKRMFDVTGVYCDGIIFALADDGVMYLKADDKTKARFEAEGLGPFMYEGKTRPVAMSYWRVPERLYDEPDEMREWAREAIVVARSAKAKKTAPLKSIVRAESSPTLSLKARTAKSKTPATLKRK